MNLAVLELIAERLNQYEICWGLGASSMLYFYGIVDHPRDLDVLVQADHVEAAFHALKGYADHIEFDESPPAKYATDFFATLVIRQQEIDLIGGYKIKHYEGVYDFAMGPERITAVRTIGKQPIPLTSLEDWYVAYTVMGDPKGRKQLILDYVKEKNGFNHPNLFASALYRLEGYLKDQLLEELKELGVEV